MNQDGVKLNGVHQLLFYADDVNMLGGSVQTIKKSSEALVVASKQTGLEVSADKSKYMVMSRDQIAAKSHNIKIDNSSSGNGGRFQISGNNPNRSKFYSGRN
jgi:hypothetical protein